MNNLEDRMIKVLIDALGDTDRKRRSNAAYVLGEIGDESVVEPLIEVLKDEDSGVRSVAAYALGKIGDERAMEPLLAALKDEGWYVRKAAARALGEIKDTRAVEPLIEVLKDSDVQQSAAQALGEIGDKRVVEPLIELLKDGNRDVRWAAARALGEIKDTRAVEPLIKAFEDFDFENWKWLTIIGISTFGKDSLTKLNKHQNTVENHYSSTHIHILTENDIINITEEIISKTELLFMVADLNDSLSKDVISKIAEKFNNKLIIGFFAGYNDNYELRGEITSIVSLEDTNINNSYWALRLIPDLWGPDCAIGFDFDDWRRGISKAKNLKFKMQELSEDQISNKTFLDSLDISECKLIIFAAYGTYNSLDMKTYSKIDYSVRESTSKDTLILSCGFVSTAPLQVMLYPPEKIKLVMLFNS